MASKPVAPVFSEGSSSLEKNKQNDLSQNYRPIPGQKRRTRFTSSIPLSINNSENNENKLSKCKSSETLTSILTLKPCTRTFSAHELPVVLTLSSKSICKLETDEETPMELSSSSVESDFSESETPLEENLIIQSEIQQNRMEYLKQKTISAFAFESLRLKKAELIKLQAELQVRKEQVAARVILHHLLLNSWRMKNGELSAVVNQNSLLHKTIDNLCLQLRVVRHIQSTEKEKSATKNKEFESLLIQLTELKRDNHKVKRELEKVELERNSLSSKIDLLSEEHERVRHKYKNLKDEKIDMNRNSKKNQIEVDKFKQINQQLKIDMERLEGTLKATSKQSSYWQEKARSSESDCWQAKLQLESQEKEIANLKNHQNALQKEQNILSLSKLKTEDKLKITKEKLAESQEKQTLQIVELKSYQEQLKEIKSTVQSLNNSLVLLKTENGDLRREVYSHSLRNVRRRRTLGLALSFIFHPLEILRSLYKTNDQ